MSEAKRIYTKAGGKFFTRHSMSYWGTEIVSGLYRNRCFITTEFDYTGMYRYFNVRRFSGDYKRIYTVSKFNRITTRKQAVNLVHNPKMWVKSR